MLRTRQQRRLLRALRLSGRQPREGRPRLAGTWLRDAARGTGHGPGNTNGRME